MVPVAFAFFDYPIPAALFIGKSSREKQANFRNSFVTLVNFRRLV
jgi:hypothetical protein